MIFHGVVDHESDAAGGRYVKHEIVGRGDVPSGVGAGAAKLTLSNGGALINEVATGAGAMSSCLAHRYLAAV